MDSTETLTTRMDSTETLTTLGTQEWAIQRPWQHWAINNGQYRDPDNIGHSRHSTKINKTEHRNLKRWPTRTPTKHRGKQHGPPPNIGENLYICIKKTPQDSNVKHKLITAKKLTEVSILQTLCYPITNLSNRACAEYNRQTAIVAYYRGSHNCLNITFQLNLLNVKKNEREYYPQRIFSINYLHGNDILTQSDAIHIIIPLPKTQFFLRLTSDVKLCQPS
jgi:hypothetical protein